MKLGCDPEIFLCDAAGSLVSSIGKIGGSKALPRPLPLGEGYAVQEDNVAVEFNIPAADTMEDMVFSINNTVNFLRNFIQEKYNLQFVNLSAAEFPEKELEDPRAKEFGCDPDFDAWSGEENPRPFSPLPNLRSCGGHVHVGHPFKGFGEAMEMGKAMDLFLGVPSVLMDKGDLRRKLYGKPGAIRFKPYGIEYRTLSNFWIFSDDLIRWVWRNTERALESLHKIAFDNEKHTIQSAISENNLPAAEALVKKYNLEVIHA